MIQLQKLVFFVSIILSVQITAAQIVQTDSKDRQVIPDMSWLNQKDGPRPKYVWENREDYIYHERTYDDSLKMTAPEIYPLIREPWVFNRSFKWIRNAEGSIISYSEGADLRLTGAKQVSAWYSDPSNKITDSLNYTIFEKINSKRRRDAAVIPSLQIHLSQHPIVEIEVIESSDDWQFVVSMKGRSGIPFLSTGWQSGSKTIRLDIASALKNKGYELNYAELHFVIGTWAASSGSRSKIAYKVRLIHQSAIVGCLPVIRTFNDSRGGVWVSAIPTNISSNKQDISFYADINGRHIKMIREGEIFKGLIKDLDIGSYLVKIVSDDKSIAGSTVFVRITDGIFWKHNKQYNLLEKKTVRFPVTGSFQGTFFFKDAGLASEQLINTQHEWDLWDREEFPGEHQHYWESLTRSEMNERFKYLSMNEWDVVYLHSHFGIWERFDASGNLAPHGVEQFFLYVDQSSKNGLSVQVTLSSYPYGVSDNKDWRSGTMPYKQTIEMGFKNEDWRNPENEPFRTIYHQYIKDFVGMFKDETGILSLSSSGEGDAQHINGVRRFQDTKQVIRSIDTNHIIVSEPFHVFELVNRLPSEMIKGYTSDMVGIRGYMAGSKGFMPENETGVYLRLMQILPNPYVGEGSFPPSNLYTKFTYSPTDFNYNSWIGSEAYKYDVRDLLYLSFVSRMPLIVTWDEMFTGGERMVIKSASQLVQWDQPFEEPRTNIIITDSILKYNREVLSPYERLLSHIALEYRFVESRFGARSGDWVIDPLKKNQIQTLMKRIPRNIRRTIPFQVSENYSVRYSRSKDQQTIIAYFFNQSNYEHRKYYLTGGTQRVPQAAEFSFQVMNVKENLHYKLYDLDSKEVVKSGISTKGMKIEIDNTKADYLLVIYP